MWKQLVLIALCLVFAVSIVNPLLDGESPLSLGLDLAGGVMVTYRPDFDSVPPRYADVPRAELLAMAKDTMAGRLASRFDTLPDVVVRDDGRLVVSLPGEHDQRRVLETLGETYRLTFRRALAVHDAPPDNPRGLVRAWEGRWLDLGEVLLDGAMLDPASLGVDTASASSLESFGQGAAVTFAFRPPYDATFAEVTRDSLGELLVILLDDQVEWAGQVESEIRGTGILRGGYTFEQATQVAQLLRAGDLPFSLDVESLSGVGPALGQDLLDRGQTALLWSTAALVLLLSVAYGHRPALLITGWLSLASLLFFTLGMISAFDLTVDLVAIAGLVLSIGMGMDAFILVFEALEGRRFGRGRSPMGRLREIYGFRGEGRTLVHANATTLLVVLLLFLPERLESFALFLSLGIVASLSTLLVTRGLLHAFARRGWLEEPADPTERPRHPLARLRAARPKLLDYRRVYFGLLAALLIGTAGWLHVDRESSWLSLGADFQPGMQLQVSLPSDHSIDSVVDSLRAEQPALEARVQHWDDASDGPDTTGFLITLEGPEWRGRSWSSSGPGQAEPAGTTLSPEALARHLDEQEVTIHGMHSIDARLSGQRVLTSSMVLIGSFLLLGFYLRHLQHRIDSAWDASASRTGAAGGRIFVGTVVAVLLDLAIALAVLALIDLPIGMPELAALLTLVGYSVNDSMVLWSHLSRPGESENDADDGASNEVAIHRGVDRILSRAALTSLSTMVPAIMILATGLEPLRGFAWVVLVGTIAGTLSSIFVVGSFALAERRGERFEASPAPTR